MKKIIKYIIKIGKESQKYFVRKYISLNIIIKEIFK